jgi:hypothetical protein
LPRGRRGLLLRGGVSRRRQLLGLLIAVYGVAGLLLVGSAAIAVARPLDQLATLGRTVETQRGSLVSALRDTSRTLADAGAGFGGFEASLAQARSSTDRAAELARDVSATMGDIGRAMGLTVFGIQPFAAIAPQFDRAATQLQRLSSDLQGIGTALNRNSADLTTARTNLERVRSQVDRLATAADETEVPAATSSELELIRFGLYGLLAWLALQAAACVVLGLFLMRARPS